MIKLIRINLRNNKKSLSYLILLILVLYLTNILLNHTFLLSIYFQGAMFSVIYYALYLNLTIEKDFLGEKNLLLNIIPYKSSTILFSHILSLIITITPFFILFLGIPYLFEYEFFAYKSQMSNPIQLLIFLFLTQVTLSIAISSVVYSLKLIFHSWDNDKDENKALMIALALIIIAFYIMNIVIFAKIFNKYNGEIIINNSNNLLVDRLFSLPYYPNFLKIENSKIVLPYSFIIANITFSAIMYFITLRRVERKRP